MASSWGTVLKAAVAAAALALSSVPAAAQITLDGSVGPAGALSGPNYLIGANLGRQTGPNLFHSFGLFNLATGESATFTGPNSVQNIIGRVTGGSLSSIDGTINSAIPGASLFLINPAGMVFGPNASINVQGAFHASTADYLRFADGARFYADPAKTSTLSIAAPAAFGFLNANPQGIVIDGSGLLGAPGALMSFVAGSVTMVDDAVLVAPGGTVQLTAAGGSGEVGVDPRSGPLTVAKLGDISITGAQSLVSLTDPDIPVGGGNIFIRAGNLLLDGATIFANTGTAITGGTINVRADQSLTMHDGSAITAASFGSGRSGDIIITAGTATLDGRSFISTSAGSTGAGGNITLAANNLQVVSGSFISADTDGAGNAGNVAINVGAQMTVDGSGTTVSADTSPTATGRAGTITIDAGALTVSSGASISSSTFGAANAGDITMSLGALTMAGGSFISSATSGGGNAGNILIQAQSAQLGANTVIFSSTTGGGSGNAGNVLLNANVISLSNGATISSDTAGSGAGGRVEVDSSGVILVDSGSLIIANADAGTGRGGSVVVNALGLEVRASGEIGSGTFGAGNAGSVQVNVSGPLVIDGSGATGTLTGISAQTNTGSTGSAGTVTVNAGNLQILNNGRISSNTSGPGSAGNVIVNAGNLLLQSNGEISTATFGAGNGGNLRVTSGPLVIDGSGGNGLTGISAQTNAGSRGNAGSVNVNASDVQITGGGNIGSNSFGLGSGGDVTVTAAGTILLTGAGPLGGPSSISAVSTAPQPAGNVTVRGDRLYLLDGGLIATSSLIAGGGSVDIELGTLLAILRGGITTSVQGGLGNGGNITIDPQFAVLNQGIIVANAFGGNGGNIGITAGTFLASPDSLIQASSQLGISGQITIQAPEIDLTSGLTVLNASFLDASALLRQSCATRAGAPGSSLISAGRGALPLTPDDPLTDFYFGARPPASPGSLLERPTLRLSLDRAAIGCGI